MANIAHNEDPKEDKMLEVNFYLNGRKYNGGDVSSFAIEKEQAIRIIQLLDSLKENDAFMGEGMEALAVVKFSPNGRKLVIAVDSITTAPVEDLDEVDEPREFIRLLIDRKDKAMPYWNELIRRREARVAKLNSLQTEWDGIEIDTDAIRRIRSYFDSPCMTADFGYRVNGKPVVTYIVNPVGDYMLTFQGKNVDVELKISEKMAVTRQIFDILRSWAAVQDFLLKVEEVNKRADGFTIHATYGIDRNRIVAKVLDDQCGTSFGFDKKVLNRYGVVIEADICSRYLNDHNVEEALTSLASEVDLKVPPLAEVLK